MERIEGHVQHYAWGSEHELPALLGVEPDGRPWAELWIGDHPRLPSTRVSTGEPLRENLSFLLKFLAADSPLSIQSHPSKEQAREGFERENAAGLAIDAPDRTYRDPNHKPELICAVSRFEALCGFRPIDEVLVELEEEPGFDPLVRRLRTGGFEAATSWLLGGDPDSVASTHAAAVAAFPLAARLHEAFPHDPGTVVALLLNRVVLAPGEAIYLGAGNLHAYLGGTAVEIMANSDNVVRGGLTPKHIDVPELLRVVDFTPLAPTVQRAVGAVHRFDTDADDFSLVRALVTEPVVFDAGGARIVFCTSGSIQLRSESGDHVSLGSGQSAFVDADDGAFTVAGRSDDDCLCWVAGAG